MAEWVIFQFTMLVYQRVYHPFIIYQSVRYINLWSPVYTSLITMNDNAPLYSSSIIHCHWNIIYPPVITGDSWLIFPPVTGCICISPFDHHFLNPQIRKIRKIRKITNSADLSPVTDIKHVENVASPPVSAADLSTSSPHPAAPRGAPGESGGSTNGHGDQPSKKTWCMAIWI